MIDYEVALAYDTEGIETELKRRSGSDWRLVYGYQANQSFFGFSDRGHVLVFMRDKQEIEEERELTSI
jgi:hypothetical protein